MTRQQPAEHTAKPASQSVENPWRDVVFEMLRRDPDLNLYWLAWENPELEEAALAIAREMSDEAV